MKSRVKSKINKRDRDEIIVAILFFLPFGAGFLIFTILPVIIGLCYSFTTFDVIQSPIFVGIRNFQYLLTEDNTFVIALTNTLKFAFFTGLIGYCASFIIAYIIDGLHFKKFFALAFYAPSITSGIAMGVIWLYFFSSDMNGLFNSLLIQNGFITQPILWTQDPSKVLIIVIIVSVWMGMGNGFLGFLAGFQNMNYEIFEAARIDGVHTKFQEMIYVILPQMKPMLLFGAINTIVGAFSIYDIPVTLAGFPGPDNAALTIVGHMNDYAFNRLDLGYATAISMVLFVITFTLGRIVFRVLGSKDEL